MTLLALVALVASVLVWAPPGSQAQANQVPFAIPGPDQTVSPGSAVTLAGEGNDGDGTIVKYEWEIETGPYSWVQIGENSTTVPDNTTTGGAGFTVPSQAFVDQLEDSDPQKYEIVVRLTVTDDDGATDSDTLTIFISQRPVADIQVYAGLLDKTNIDPDASIKLAVRHP
jgi:hypothetical protein